MVCTHMAIVTSLSILLRCSKIFAKNKGVKYKIYIRVHISLLVLLEYIVFMEPTKNLLLMVIKELLKTIHGSS